MSSKVVLVGGGQPTKDLSDFAMKTDIPESADLSQYALKGQVDIDDGTGVPDSATATGVAGTFIVSADTIYVCVATDTWVKAALAWA